MKAILLTSLLAVGSAASLRAGGVNIHVNVGTAPYYGYAPREVVYVERYVPAYDVPRVLVVSRYARVHPSAVVGYYRKGWGWDRICRRYHVPAHAVYGPYGPARGFAKGHYKHGRWRD